VARLEEVRRACPAPNVFYLVGSADVLPLTDAAVDAILVTVAVVDRLAADEFLRVLRTGGLVSVFDSNEDRTDSALNLGEHEVEEIFSGAGFAEVTVAPAQGRLYGTARKP
jgi:ubiquinone/menaquinone biosynthesis C-methylase UbiE